MAYTKNSTLAQTICKIEYINLLDVSTVTTLLGISTVTLLSGKAWSNFYFSPGTAEFDGGIEQTVHGQIRKQVLSFFYPGVDPDDEVAFEMDTLAKWLVKITYSDNSKQLMGDKMFGVQLSNTFNSKDSGQKVTFNCTTCYPLRKVS
jgi:hypothetical protein